MASDEYTIGWVCALPIEKAAARGMLDEIHDTSFNRAASDKNSYTLGRIGPHNVVVANLPSGVYGETPAATVAAHMLASFQTVRIGLLVGIGGGIPSRCHDIRLGDVVVSRPEGTLGGVVQFDRGKTIAEGRFVRTGVLNKPPLVLLSALAELDAEHEMEGSKIPSYIAEMGERYPKMRTDYSCQSSSNDVLYRSEYNHNEDDDSTCELCDPSQIAQRSARQSEDPVIHYGIIASSNQVVKDSLIRDRIGTDLGAICLEMEAAGIMDTFPCVVIRGISDYADSHKNKRWQRYAAATAAAYAKELLYKVPPNELRANPTALQALRSELSEISQDVQSLKQKLYLDALPVAEGAAFDSYDNERSPHCHPETRVELLGQVYKWSCDPKGKSILWLNGMAGTGKSTIARTLARSLHKDARLAASFFFKRGEASRGDASRLFTTIASQIASSIPMSAEYIRDGVQSTPLIADKGLGIQFSELIVQPLRQLQLVSPAPNIIVLDALNECDDIAQVKAIIQLFSGPSMEKINLRVFVTSRPDTAIRVSFNQLAHEVYDRLILHDVAQETIDHDIRVVLVDEMRRTVHDYNAVVPSTDAVLTPDWPGSECIDQLVEISSPLFISAATICRFLGDSRFSPNHQLEKLLEQRSASHASKLDFTYLPVLDQILAGDLTKREKDYLISEFHSVVGSLVLLAEPLSAFHLARLLGIPKDRVDTNLGHLHAVLGVSGDGAPVRLFHASFRDFLLDEDLAGKTPFAIHGPAVHRHLLQRCLDSMSGNAKPVGFPHRLYRPAATGVVHVPQKQEAFDGVLPGDLRYSHLYWIHHLEQTKETIRIGDGVHRFLETHFLDWVSALGILNQPSRVLNSVQTLISLIDETSSGSPLWQLLLDARRFVYGHKPAIERIPQMIHSSVIFLPRSSSIRKTFMHLEPAWITERPNVPQDWGQPALHVDGVVLNSLAFAPDNSRLASESRVWDATSGHVLHTVSQYRPRSTMDLVHNYQEGIKALAFRSAQELAIVTRGGQLKSWNLATGEKTALQLASAINDAVFSGDASKLAFIASSNPFKVPIKQFPEPSISVRDNITGRIIVKIDRVEHALLSLSLDGSRLACCIMPDHESFTDTQVVVFELTPHRSTKRSVIPGPLAHVALVALSPNGCKLAVFGEEKSTRLLVILDIETCEQEQTFPVSEWITCMSFSPDGATLTVVLEKKEFRQVDLATGEVQMIRKHCRHDVVAFAPDGLRIATAPRKANGIEVWNSLGNPDNVLYQKPSCDLDNCLPLFALCPDGSVAATARIKSNTILLVDIASKGIKHELQACGVPEAVAFSHDGTTMAAKTLSYVSEKEDDGEMDLTTGELDDLVVIEKHISTNRDKCWLEFWNIETIPSLRFRKTFPVAYRKSLLAVSPDGTRVALALIDDTQAGASRGTTVEECDVLRTDLVRRYHVQQPVKMSKIRYSADGEWLELINYKPSEPPGITTTTRIRLWQFEYAWGYWACEPVTEHAISKWHIQKYHFPRTGIWVTEDEAWIRYDRHYILYIPAHLRPMQHVYLGTSFDSVCDGTGGAVIGWITVEGLFTSFKIDLNKLRLAISGSGDEG